MDLVRTLTYAFPSPSELINPISTATRSSATSNFPVLERITSLSSAGTKTRSPHSQGSISGLSSGNGQLP